MKKLEFLNVRKKTKIILLFFALLSMLCAFFYFSVEGSSFSAKALELNVESEIFSSYKTGSEFVAPKGSIIYEGTEYEASPILFYPDGTPCVKDSYYLNSVGEYVLVYEATIDGDTVSLQKTFMVFSQTYDIGANATLTYRDTLEKVQGNSSSGLFVSLPENDTFTYNEPIDIYDYDSEKPLICFHPYNNGGNGTTYREALRHVVRLTDCYDENNYIDFILSWDYSNHITKTAALFYRASVAGGTSIGLRSTTENSGFLYNGQYYEVRTSKFGAASPQYTLTDDGVSVYFDPIENIFYAQGSSKVLVSKLDSFELYGAEAFSGFTTGEVYLSLFAEEYYEGSVNLEISKLAGYEQKELFRENIYDNRKPVITLDVNTKESVYYVAKNETVVLPKATATDVNLIDDVSVSVYVNYGTSSCRQISCVDGVFSPKTEGRYTVVYSAIDSFGNVGTKIILFSCVNMSGNKSIDFNVEELSSLTAGAICELPTYSASSLNGDVIVNTYYRFESETEKIPILESGFLVENIGLYEIIYEYTDGVFSYEKKYFVDSVPSDNITFDVPILPKYLIADAKYTFDDVHAYSYENAVPTKHDVTVYLIKDGVEDSSMEVDYLNVSIPKCSTVLFKYVYGNKFVYSAEIPVVDVGFENELKMENYFVGDFDKTANSSCVSYLSKKMSGTNVLDFVNVLSLSSFSFACYIDEGFGNFYAIDICLTDFYDRSKSVTISYINRSGTTLFACGDTSVNTDEAFENYTHKFYYNATDDVFSDMSGKSMAWNNNFTTDKVLLSVSVRNIQGLSKVKILEVCGTGLSDDTGDYFKPFLNYKNVGGTMKMGDVITLYTPYALDVLCPFLRSDLTMSVITPSGNNAISNDSVVLQVGCDTGRDYTLTLTENGKYRVMYTYMDKWGNQISTSFFANVSDTIPPEIVLDDGYNGTIVNVKLNENVQIKSYSVSDDKTDKTDLVVKIMVYSPTFEQVFVNNGAFIAKKTGQYTVYYYVYDSVGNYAVATYKVNVN